MLYSFVVEGGGGEGGAQIYLLDRVHDYLSNTNPIPSSILLLCGQVKYSTSWHSLAQVVVLKRHP